MIKPWRRVLGSLLAIGGFIGGAVAVYARYIAPYRPKLERISFVTPPGHDHLAGLTIGFLTDTHIGPFFQPTDLLRATKLLQRERPDLLLLGGDFISESPRYIYETAKILGDLAKSTPYGGFAVLGNHDLGLVPPKIIDALEASGITVLRNQAVPISTSRGCLWIAGIDETLIGSPDPAGTIAQAGRGNAVLALWHEAQFAEQAAAAGAFAQLSGHTHGGQIRLPLLGPLALPVDGTRHTYGFSSADDMPVYTSRGVGIYRPPVRFNCPPEVTLITLVRHENH